MTGKTEKIPLDQNLLIIFSITLMAVLGVSSLTPVFPQVVEVFGIRRQEVTWLITAFTFPGVILSPFFGVLADRWGRKRLLVPSLFLFGIAGAACGLVRDYNLLIALRFVQGIGAAVLGTIAVIIIGDLYSDRSRLKVMGLNASVLSIATASFPEIGGILASLHWSVPFFLPLTAIPIGFWVTVSLRSPEPRNSQTLKVYLKGALTGMFSGRIILLLGLGLLTFIILFGQFLTFLPLCMADRFGANSVIIGVMLAISSLASAFISSRLGWIGKRLHVRTILIIAFLFYTVVMYVIPSCRVVGFLILPMLLYGTAQGLNIPSLQTLIAASAPIQYRGAYMSIIATVFRIGQTVGPPLAALAYTYGGMTGIFRIAAVAAFTGIISILVMGKRLAIVEIRQDVQD